METKFYPVQALNKYITDILNEIISADIPNNVKQGLSNKFYFVDLGTTISCPAEIVPDCNGRYKVKLSAAYCQYLWLICDIALKSIDFNIIKQQCDNIGISLNDLKKITEQLLQQPKIKAIQLIQQYYPQRDAEMFLAYLERMNDLLNYEELSCQLEIDKNLIMQLIPGSSGIDMESFNHINLQGKYEETVNSVYCHGIAFVLLHEISHLSLGHLNKQYEDLEDEQNADISAFWNMYNDLDATKKFTANCGILCTLFSLLYLNPQMAEDGIHPREDYRIMEIYEQIKDDDIKYTILVVYMFKYWSSMNNIAGFPDITSDTIEDAMEQIKKFFLDNSFRGVNN